MKHVLLINGSPHKNGCTFTALSEIAAQLEKNGVSSEIVSIGTGPVRGCIACGGCRKKGECVFGDDPANEIARKLAEADGVIIGSPIYYAGPNGALLAILDRVFFSRSGAFDGKPGAAIVSCRRGGASAGFDRLNKYFTAICRWSPASIGTPSTATPPRRCGRTWRACRSCAPWPTTWPGC